MSWKGTSFLFLLSLILFSYGCASVRGPRLGLEQPLDYHNGALILDVPVSGKTSPLHPFTSLAEYWGLSPRDLPPLKALAEHPDLPVSEQADLLLESLANSGWFIHSAQLSNDDLIERLTHGIPILAVTAAEPLSPSSISWWLVYGHSQTEGWKAVGAHAHAQGWVENTRFTAWRENALHLSFVLCPEQAVTWPLSTDEQYSLAQHFERKEDWGKSFAIWEEISSGSRLSDDWVNRGNAARNGNDLEEAERAYQQAVELNPSDPAPYNNLAFLYLETGRPADFALGYIRKAVDLAPENPYFLDTLGFALMTLGEFEDASVALEKARSRSKNLPVHEQIEIHQRLLASYNAQGFGHLARQVEKQLQGLKNQAARLEKIKEE